MPKSYLYSSVRSPHCFKVSLILEEKGVPFERIEIDLRGKEQKTAPYLAINPLGQVPVYEDDRGVHIDSLVIMQYLDKRYPTSQLFPKNESVNKEVLDWIEHSSTTMRDTSHYLYWQLLEPPQKGTDWGEVERLKAQGYDSLKAMEADLEKHGDWLCGDLSAADFSVFAWVYGFKRFDLPESWDNYPNVQSWYKRLEARPSVAASYGQKGQPFKDFLAAR